MVKKCECPFKRNEFPLHEAKKCFSIETKKYKRKGKIIWLCVDCSFYGDIEVKNVVSKKHKKR